MLFTANLFFANDKKINKAKLTEVTVYQNGAQLRGHSSYSTISGINEIIIEGISANIDAKTIQISATGNVVILDSKYALFYPKVTHEESVQEVKETKLDIIKLKDSILYLSYDLSDLQNEINVYTETIHILKNNGLMKSHGKVNDSIELLQEALELYTNKMNELNKKLSALKKSQNKSQKVKKKMDERLKRLKSHLGSIGNNHSKQQAIPRLTVTLSANSSSSGRISFSYLASGAGWNPLYDIRSESSQGKIFMNYKAEVYQNTGLNWENIKLSISTNNPYANKTKPELNPWYLSYVEYKKRIVPDRKGRSDNKGLYNLNSKPAEAAYNQGFYMDQISENEEFAMEANQFTQVVQQLVSAQFDIDLPYNIASNGEKHMVLVQNSELETNFKYYSVPKIDQSVYLVAEMLKIDELQLIPSKANIFFDGSYVGETYIDPTTMNDTLYLSLGKDPSIQIKRRLLSAKCKEKTIGDKIEKTLAYTIEVKNLKSRSIELVVQDQVPITTNDDITIEKINIGKGKRNERSGRIEWNLTLKPKESKTIDFEFRIKYDKSQRINI
jgi:uncharacterized protein (TIGR02231 family)